MMFFINYQLAV